VLPSGFNDPFKMNIYKKNWLKYSTGLVVCLLIRLIPFRAPNIEPVFAAQMPFSKSHGKIAGFLFGFLSIILYDITTGKAGIWTFITAFAYGILGIWASIYLKNKKNNGWNYAKFAIMGTIVYDAVTGLSIGPLFFHQPFIQALTGQIPFTALHLLGNISFALIVSPALYSFIIENKKNRPIASVFNPTQTYI
jgi:energy-coupling factor transport system substrate-specific component